MEPYCGQRQRYGYSRSPQKPLGLAGTQSRVFYGSATPSVPYEVNDVWFRTSGSGSSLTTTLYISNADKGDGETASADGLAAGR